MQKHHLWTDPRTGAYASKRESKSKITALGVYPYFRNATRAEQGCCRGWQGHTDDMLCINKICLELNLFSFQEFLLPRKSVCVQHRLASALFMQHLPVDLIDVDAIPRCKVKPEPAAVPRVPHSSREERLPS